MEQPKDTTDAKAAGAGGKNLIPEGKHCDGSRRLSKLGYGRADSMEAASHEHHAKLNVLGNVTAHKVLSRRLRSSEH